MQHISQTILKESEEVMNQIVAKTINKLFYFQESCEKCALQEKPV